MCVLVIIVKRTTSSRLLDGDMLFINSTKSIWKISVIIELLSNFHPLTVRARYLSLKEEAKRKQNIIQSILDQNAELLKLNNSYLNNSISQYVENGSRNNEKNQENSSRQISEKLKLKSGQRKDLQDNKENKKHSQVKRKKQEKKNIYIVGDSMLKNITGSGLSKDHTVKIRPHPGVTTIDMIDYIKPELRHKPDIVILHCGTNDITNDVNTVKKIKNLVKEIEK